MKIVDGRLGPRDQVNGRAALFGGGGGGGGGGGFWTRMNRFPEPGLNCIGVYADA
ncbi:hypothetical protein PDIG_55530 [Penicillium digitatum PHI26]|uniref:Uncharacterized protein n=1 Tax=Penicillium digitatum (strain PHI26 / CECT 20796) TaxID=1170229 RepID=K9FM63_PEND2|nr:hypothetical protein PDIG_55530 [Penicillium digitatum PHI26]